MRRRIPAIAIIAPLLLLVGGLLLVRSPAHPGGFKLSDGTFVEIVKITSGPKHRLRYGNSWKDYLGTALPKALRAKLNSRVLEIGPTNSGSLVIWTRSQFTSALFLGFEFTVADEAGIEMAVPVSAKGLLQGALTSPARPTVSGRLGTNENFYGWLISPLPHHVREIGIGFYENQKRIGFFKWPNPAYHPTKDVPLDQPPLVKSAGEVQVKLSSIDVRKNRANPSRVAWTVRAELLRQGVPPLDWQLESMEVLSDGEVFAQTGTVASLAYSGSFQSLGWISPRSFRISSSIPGSFGILPPPRAGDTVPLQPLPGPWPNTVWTVRFRAVQHANFAPEQIWVLRNLPVTNALEFKIDRSETRKLGSRKVQLLGLHGPQVSWSGTNGTGRSFSGDIADMHLCFAGPPESAGVRIAFLSGHDDQGRTLFPLRTSLSTSTAPWTLPRPAPGEPESLVYGFQFRPASGAQSMTLEFAVHEAKAVDFVVKPALITHQ